MKLGGRRVGNLTIFIDSSCDEVLLKIETNPDGAALVSFHLYDSNGQLVMDCPEAQIFPEGLSVSAPDGEVLLEIPSQDSGIVTYSLYNSSGKLLTASDGKRTQIFGGLRMGGKN